MQSFCARKQHGKEALCLGSIFRRSLGSAPRRGEEQPRTQPCSRYPSDQRRLGTERDRRIFPTSLTGDVTSEIAEDDWERGWEKRRSVGSFPISSLHQQVKERTSDKTNKVKELRLLPEGINLITSVLCAQCPFIHLSDERPCIKAKFLV